MSASPLLTADGISKSFGGARALSDVSLDVKKGEVHALCGENGAGKSTLIKILAGSYAPDKGRILMDNLPLPPGDIRASEKAGIHALYQESTAFPHLCATENIFMGREPVRMGGLLLDKKTMRLETKKLLENLGEVINQKKPVGQLPMAQRQMIGIARALLHKSRVLIMDEPTASLSERETAALFRIIRQLRDEGVSVLYISHRLEEIFEISDRVTVLRDGRLVATKPTPDVTKTELIRMMVGREVSTSTGSTPPSQEEKKILLEVQGISRKNSFVNISFHIRAGEVLGLAGLVGAGRSEMAQTIFGVTKPDSGTVLIEGKPLASGSVQEAVKKGVALVPEDRQRLGLILPMPIGVNLTLAVLRSLTRFGICSSSKENILTARLMKELDVRASDPSAAAETLSGGNQQKLVIGKWLAVSPRILLLDEPTRGVDVGAKAEIYQLIRRLSSQGMATLVISSDLPEILSLSDRILVMRSGEISGELSRDEASQEKILSLALPKEEARSNAVLTGSMG